jgi:multiple sugar transport system ATP-binding protein
MNLVPCTVRSEGDRSYLVGEGLRVKLPADARNKVLATTKNENMLFGVRPQHLTLRQGEVQPNGYDLVSGTVYVSEPLGAETLVRVRVGKELMQVLADDKVQVALDEKVSLEVPPDRFFLFDTVTEKRIW